MTTLFSTFLAFFISISYAFGQTKSWVPLKQEVNDWVRHFTIYKGQLIASGEFTKAGSIDANSIAAWDGVKWLPLEKGFPVARIRDMLVFDTLLYIVGNLDLSSTEGWKGNDIAWWDGKKWHKPSKASTGEISSIISFNNELYVAGYFDSVGGVKARNIARWDGISWQPLGRGINNSTIRDLYLFKDELYVLGWFDSAGSVACKNIARWNGTKWNSVSIGVSNYYSAMINWKGKLLIGSDNDTNPDIEEIKQWDGNTITTFSRQEMDKINGFIVFNNDLYCTQYGLHENGTSLVYKWNEDSLKWKPVGTGPNFSVYAIAEYNGELHCGGAFNTFNYSYMNYIGRLTDNVGISSIKKKPIIELWPNPCTIKQTITIQFSKPQALIIELFDVSGRLVQSVYNGKVWPGEQTFTSDLGFLCDGIYFYTINLGGNKLHNKIIKQ